ncbi:MAG: hypothetical protein NC123_18900 [Butyrivibrio sp.]|nr:hypothetical protein [Acetatifactor muris]MCM1561581.1 hypothetical protein [Butyrivibrio sp.]
MQKVEIVLNGLEEEQCAELISCLISETIKHFDVSQVRGYCGPAPVKKGNGDLLVPDFMRCRQLKPDGKIRLKRRMQNKGC